VLAVRGRGVFSTVVFCRDTSPVPTREGIVPPSVVAIKIIRNNDVMRKAADKEMELLRVSLVCVVSCRHVGELRVCGVSVPFPTSCIVLLLLLLPRRP